MSDDLVFMMGKFAAPIPQDRGYASNHHWLMKSEGSYLVGFTAYSVRLLQDVYFLAWNIEPGTAVRQKQEIGEIESSKALSTLHAPYDGTVLEFNEDLLNDPTAINTDGYGAGWLYRFVTNSELINPPDYVKLLETGWENTQRLLKGQIN